MLRLSSFVFFALLLAVHLFTGKARNTPDEKKKAGVEK